MLAVAPPSALSGQSIAQIAASVARRQSTATAQVLASLSRIRLADGQIGAVVTLLEERALAMAAALDARIAAGENPGPLAGVPFGVKALFDMQGLPTTAGAAMRASAEPAKDDAAMVRLLCAAGAIPVAVLNMDEFAYGFVTVNAHYGTTHNPHDLTRLAGGSSGGSAAAVAGGLLPLTLGSDTNGSIRVPASLCGVYGFRPAWGSVDMGGTFPFVESLDVIGPFAASAADLELAMAVCAPDLALGNWAGSLRLARLGGWFAQDLNPGFEEAFAAISAAFGPMPTIELPDVAAARSAAFLITASEGGALHLPELRRRAGEFDPATRDRFIAGCLLPAQVREEAEAFASRFRARALALFNEANVLIAPATTDVAPLIDHPVMRLGGIEVAARANLGMLAQPISLTGFPVLTAPLLRVGQLPLGIQLIAAPGCEAALFAAARRLEEAGITGFTAPPATPPS